MLSCRQIGSNSSCIPHASPSSNRIALASGLCRSTSQHQQFHINSCTPAVLHQQQHCQHRHVQPLRAVKDEDAEVERIAREAAGSDIWSSELAGNVVKVGLVAGVLAAVLFIANLAKPLYDNTIKSFPTPAEYEQYELRDEGSL